MFNKTDMNLSLNLIRKYRFDELNDTLNAFKNFLFGEHYSTVTIVQCHLVQKITIMNEIIDDGLDNQHQRLRMLKVLKEFKYKVKDLIDYVNMIINVKEFYEGLTSAFDAVKRYLNLVIEQTNLNMEILSSIDGINIKTFNFDFVVDDDPFGEVVDSDIKKVDEKSI